MDIATLLKLGEFSLLTLVLIGGWKLARPAVEAWLAQYQQLIDHLLKMTEALALMNAQLEELHKDHGEITEILRDLNGKK